MPSIGDLPDSPLYPIRVVEDMTGIPAVTQRMWQRRYAVVDPIRSAGNYRLYSDRDVALLRWLKHQVDSGTPIRHAAARLTEMRGRGEWPEALPSLGPLPASPAAAERLSRRLFDSLVTADERGARAILRQAGTRYDLDTLCLRILTPCLVEIGEAWHRGEIRVAQEHFASAFLRAHLLSLYQTYPLRRNAPRAFVGCAPSEQHEIGALMVALFLRRGGCRVDYLGANLDAADLTAYARDQRPQLVALSAASDEAALALDPAARRLRGLKPSPLFVYGGQAFNQEPSLRLEIPGRFLGEDAASGARTALSLLHLR